MSNFIENVQWDNPNSLRYNRLYGLQRPRLENVLFKPEGMVINDLLKFGQATYKYDFGRPGRINSFFFEGIPLLKFRLKMTSTINALENTEFIGTEKDRFSGNSIDTIKYNVTPNVYNILQSNGLHITGVQSGSTNLFENSAKLSLNTLLSDTYTIMTSARLTVDNDITHDSGSVSFIELDNGINNIQVQKYYTQIRSQIVDTAGNSLGQDVNDNDIILGESVEIKVNNVLSESTSILSDGYLGTIKDIISDPVVVDEFRHLKEIDESVDFFSRKTLQHNCTRILGLRADFSLTGILADLQQGLIYSPKRINGYYAMQVPIVNPKADILASEIRSLNFNSKTGQYELAEINDHWLIDILVPAGVHYYSFIVDGQSRLDSQNPNTISIASGVFSTLIVESTQIIRFSFDGMAKEVFLSGTFNNFNKNSSPMKVGPDSSEILKILFRQEPYCNNHSDWHKMEITFEKATPVTAIRFLTAIPFEQQQRVRILLDDVPITRDEWEIRCMPEETQEPGVSECAAYSNILAAGPSAECLSYFINNTDTITASEDGWVEWHFLANNTINDRKPRFCKKVSIMTRLENLSLFQRAHRGLEILTTENFVGKVTDFLISDNEIPFRANRQTQIDSTGIWTVPQTVLHAGINTITPIQLLDETTTYGDSIIINQPEIKSFIEPFNESGIALNNTEIACTLSTHLTAEVTKIIEVMDLGDETTYGYSSPPDERFTRESFTRASDRLRVVVVNIDIIPVKTYYLHLVGQPTNFLLEVYETLQEAQTRTNRVGYAQSSGYGFQVISVFVAERQVNTASGMQDVIVDNIIVCFDEHAANVIFKTTPRANT